ncbi:MAG: DoxX family membrane protein [Saprospirales bacterium]|nr:MAG: DoxX family membrane protein [Saprospirales bacterium]
MLNKIDEKIEKTYWYSRMDQSIRNWMKAYGLKFLRISIGLVFFWFGILKFFPGLSPAYELAVNTISVATFGLIPESSIIVGLATWEVLIGLGLLTGKFMRFTLLLLFLQMPGTFLPVFIFPELVFVSAPFVPTIEGQYIFKNLVLISGGIVLGAFLEKHPTGGVKDLKVKTNNS